MSEVKFYEEIKDELLQFAVILSKANGKWVLCKHKDRDTYEAPGGHRETGESILETARRELMEETGAVEFSITPICMYSIKGETRADECIEAETFGMLYCAEIQSFGDFHSEIEKVILTDDLNVTWTYPMIQPMLIDEAKRRNMI